jgi:hypothetical protein
MPLRVNDVWDTNSCRPSFFGWSVRLQSPLLLDKKNERNGVELYARMTKLSILRGRSSGHAIPVSTITAFLEHALLCLDGCKSVEERSDIDALH